MDARRAALVCMLAFGSAACVRLQEPDAFHCASDADCDSRERCLASMSGRCVPKSACLLHTDCGPSQLCQAGKCASVECTDRAAAACPPYACDFTRGSCLTECTDNAHCAEGFACREGSCEPRECDENALTDQCRGYACAAGLCATRCSVSTECTAGFECVDKRCAPRKLEDGSLCSDDLGCTSGHCCPEPGGRYLCAPQCHYLGLGSACTWDGICESQQCDQGICIDCPNPPCANVACAQRECGQVDGFDCGYCERRALCASGQCVPVCVGMTCGVDQGVSCGRCGDGEWCDAANQCQPACVGLDCGLDHGVACGECSGTEFCAEAERRCTPACIDMECGQDHGFACGSCGSDQLCDSGRCVNAECTAGEDYCEHGDHYRCNAAADERTLLDACELSEFCSPSTGCQADVCVPDRFVCVGTVLARCAADGSGGIPGGTDCQAVGYPCTTAGCGTTRVDVLDSDATSAAIISSARIGNYYTVTQTKVLGRFTQFAYARDVNATVITSFAVYESTALGGEYTRIAYAPDIWGLESPDLNVMLISGRSYLLAATVRSSLDNGVSIFRKTPASAPVATSFGYWQAGHFGLAAEPATLGASMDTTLYDQQVVTIDLAP